MRVLALDTSTRAGSVALVEDWRVLAERAGDPSRTHAERLPVDALELLSELGWTTSDVDLFAVASGPGSFTGLRVGIATAQGLALVHRKHVVPVPALRALAEAAAKGQPRGATVAAWMDAHRGDVFSALYEISVAGSDTVATLSELDGPVVGRPSDALDRWAAAGLPQVICGDGASIYASMVPGTTAVLPHPSLAGIVGRLAVTMAAAGAAVVPASVLPLYVRRPDAEVLRDAAQLKR